jgi:hypothetical protein
MLCPNDIQVNYYHDVPYFSKDKINKINKYSNGTFVPQIYHQRSQDQPAAMHIAQKGTAGVANTKTART